LASSSDDIVIRERIRIMDEILFADYVVTCRTGECGNEDISIPIKAPAEDPHFICGVCSKNITDITLVTE
jgi:hypothetical protein